MSKRLVTTRDLLNLKFTGEPRLSPDGQKVAFVITTMNEELNGYESSLYITNLDGEIKRLTEYKLSDQCIRDKNPVWGNDSETVFFESNRSSGNQVWKISTSGGEAVRLTDFDEGINQFQLSPTGDELACIVKVEEDKPENEDITVVESLRYLANGRGFVTGYNHLFLYRLNTHENRQLTDGKQNTSSPFYSPDGKKLFYQKTRENPEENGYFSDLYVYRFSEDEEEQLYEGKGYFYDASVSPDGNWIAFVGDEGGEISTDNAMVWLLPVTGGEAHSLTLEFDRPVGDYVGIDAAYDGGGLSAQWQEDSTGLLFLSTIGGNCVLMQATLDGAVSDFYSEEACVIHSFSTQKGKVVINKSTPVSPSSLYVIKEDNAISLHDPNQTLLAEIEIAKPQPFSYKSVDDWTIEGWIIYPPNAKTADKIPSVVEIHGGPHTAYGNGFHHEFQCLAAHGYAVIYTNPRGSQGYGKTFTEACRGDWGGKDRQDIMNGLNYCLKHYPDLDEDQLYVTGGSYGGYMTNMVISHTNRFKAAVTQRCISNIYSFFGTSDIGYYFGFEQLGKVDLWDDEDTIMKFSPIRYAKNVSTPTCIIHSEEDYRCPIEQAEQWYVALRRLGVDTRFVRFKGENHELSRSGKPKNRLTRLEEIINWFNKYSGIATVEED